MEQSIGELASAVAGRPVRAVCNDSGEWDRLASQDRFDPATVWGFVVMDYEASTDSYRPSDSMQLSQPACFYLDEYRRVPLAEKEKVCQAKGTFQLKTAMVKVTRRIKVNGKWRTRVSYATRTTKVPVGTPSSSVCHDYLNRVFALQTISHESQHLLGIRDEATAECNGMQKLAWFAERFGARPEQAGQMAGDYYGTFYLQRTGTAYYQPNCSDPSVG